MHHGIRPIEGGHIRRRMEIAAAPTSRVCSGSADWVGELDVRHLLQLSTSLLPNDVACGVPRARRGLYHAGVESFVFWDCTPGRGHYTESWSALRRLGHKEELLAWAEGGRPDLSVARRPLTSPDGWGLAYATPV